MGLRDGVDLFEWGWFYHYYLPIFALYRESKLYIRRNGNLITTICSLKCKNCIGNIDILENKAHRPLAEIIAEIDATFKCFDYTEIFYLIGGEANMHPNIKDVIRHIIHSRHADGFGNLVVCTNGLFRFDDEYVELLKTTKTCLEWTDYTDTLDDKKKTRILDNVECLRNAGLKIATIHHDYWVDFGKGEVLEYSDDELLERFHSCNVCINIRDHPVPACAKGYNMGKHFRTGGKDFIPLNGDNENDRFKHMVLELTYGFCENGLPNACRFCKGHFGINDDKVVAGEQAE